MLGLERGAVRLEPHDQDWLRAAEVFASAVRQHTGLPPTQVQHVGSTAVPGLVAKPILDMVVGATTPRDVDRLAAQIVELGYVDRGYGKGSNGRLLVRESAPNVRIIHLHIVPFGSEYWRHYVAFRDALRCDPELRERYGRLKGILAERFGDERKSYAAGKESFIADVLVALGVSA